LAKGTETNKKTGTSTENIKISTASIVETKEKNKVHPESNKLKFEILKKSQQIKAIL
jgi:hypothetical protein